MEHLFLWGKRRAWGVSNACQEWFWTLKKLPDGFRYPATSHMRKKPAAAILPRIFPRQLDTVFPNPRVSLPPEVQSPPFPPGLSREGWCKRGRFRQCMYLRREDPGQSFLLYDWVPGPRCGIWRGRAGWRDEATFTGKRGKWGMGEWMFDRGYLKPGVPGLSPSLLIRALAPLWG